MEKETLEVTDKIAIYNSGVIVQIIPITRVTDTLAFAADDGKEWSFKRHISHGGYLNTHPKQSHFSIWEYKLSDKVQEEKLELRFKRIKYQRLLERATPKLSVPQLEEIGKLLKQWGYE